MITRDSTGPDELFPLPGGEPVDDAIDRRTFLMRNAVIGAAAVMTGATWTPEARA